MNATDEGEMTSAQSQAQQHTDDLNDSIEIQYKSDDEQKVPTASASADTGTKQNQDESEETSTSGKCHTIMKKFNQIFDASGARITSFRMFKNMFFFYVFCIWDTLTDILVIISLSKNCKKATFQESNQLHTYYILLTLSYLSSIIGIINVGRQYWTAIMAYALNEKETKSIWNDGFKYVTIKYTQELHVANHCTTAKKLRSFFVVFEDWIQFSVTHTLLLFFQDAEVVHLLSWATSLLSITYTLGTDIFSIIRGSCIKYCKCCKCCHLEERCYDRSSRCMNISYCVTLFVFGIPLLFAVPLYLFTDYDAVNSSIVGGIIHYKFEGTTSWIGANDPNPVVYNLTGTIRTNPFGEDWRYHMCQYCDDGDPTQHLISFQINHLKVYGPYTGSVTFHAVAIDGETSYFFDNQCTDLDTGVINCSMSSKDLEAQHSYVDSSDYSHYSPNSSFSSVIYYNVSVWKLQYDFVYYETCRELQN